MKKNNYVKNGKVNWKKIKLTFGIIVAAGGIGITLCSCDGKSIKTVEIDTSSLVNSNANIEIKEIFDSVEPGPEEILFEETQKREEANSVEPGPDEILFDETQEREDQKKLDEAKNDAKAEVDNYISPNSPYEEPKHNFTYPSVPNYYSIVIDAKDKVDNAGAIDEINRIVQEFKENMDNLTKEAVEMYNNMVNRFHENENELTETAYMFENFDRSKMDVGEKKYYFDLENGYFVEFSDWGVAIDYLNGDNMYILSESEYKTRIDGYGYIPVDDYTLYTYLPESDDVDYLLNGAPIISKENAFIKDIDNQAGLEKLYQSALERGQVVSMDDLVENYGCNGNQTVMSK